MENRGERMEVDGETEQTWKKRDVSQAESSAGEEEQQKAKEKEKEEEAEDEGFLLKALRGFDKLREKLKGKVMFRNRATGEIRVSGEIREVGRDNEEKIEFEKVTEIEDEIEIEVELREEKKGMGSERGSLFLGGSESVEGYSFLGLLGEEGEDEREKKRREQRKRRVEEQVRIETRERG
jgi:hypothetical protein